MANLMPAILRPFAIRQVQAGNEPVIRGGGRHPCLPWRAASCRPDQRPIFQRFQSFKAAPAGLEARLHVRQNA